MGRLLDLAGLVFHSQKVLKRSSTISPSGNAVWDVECLNCGRFYECIGRSILHQNKGCGCLTVKTHGFSNDPETIKFYSTWKGMIDHCYNPNTKRFKDYGGRGIIVCDEWRTLEEGPPAFVAWGRLTCKDLTLTLDRSGINGPYSPANCTWETWEKQAQNKQTTIWVNIPEYEAPICLKEASRLPCCKIGYEGAIYRIKKKGWDPYQAIVTPPIKGGKKR